MTTSPSPIPPPLPRSFYLRDTITVARALLGQQLIHIDPKTGYPLAAGIIVETEAYLGVIDRAAHTFNHRKTPRVAPMWGPPGHAYIYFTYGLHHCFNAVTQPKNNPQAVLIRALQPSIGIDFLRKNRPHAHSTTQLTSGPAKLTQALAINLSHNNLDLTSPSSPIQITQLRTRAYPHSLIQTTPRIGVHYAKDWAKKPLRFYLINNPHISRP